MAHQRYAVTSDCLSGWDPALSCAVCGETFASARRARTIHSAALTARRSRFKRGLALRPYDAF
jgi:hypothetical protein